MFHPGRPLEYFHARPGDLEFNIPTMGVLHAVDLLEAEAAVPSILPMTICTVRRTNGTMVSYHGCDVHNAFIWWHDKKETPKDTANYGYEKPRGMLS